MARILTFQLNRTQYTSTPVKVDRKKLYGWTEIVALDEYGNECKLVTTDQTGTLIIPKGGTAMALLSSKGEWVERNTLKAIRENGKPAEIIPSSYTSVIKLKNKITAEEFLDYSITDFYQLTAVPYDFIGKIENDIYLFDYTYLDSYEASPAFIMAAEGELFMLVGYKNKFEMLCLGDCKTIDEDDGDYILVDEDIDFSMFI